MSGVWIPNDFNFKAILKEDMKCLIWKEYRDYLSKPDSEMTSRCVTFLSIKHIFKYSTEHREHLLNQLGTENIEHFLDENRTTIMNTPHNN